MAEHSFTIITEEPNGVSPIKSSDRQAVIRAYVGDTVSIVFRIPDEVDPVLKFAMRNNVFSPETVYEAELDDEPVGNLIQVVIESEDTAALRRGSYVFALTAESESGEYEPLRIRTLATGTLILDYSPSSPHRDVPYRR